MTRIAKLIHAVQRNPRLTTKEYADLVGRPHASVRRDLDELAKQSAVRRTRNWETLKWDGKWEAVRT
jgi:DeoR/GlpR family transcriptional regulator of sugar metabolism